jgi:predicted ATPase
MELSAVDNGKTMILKSTLENICGEKYSELDYICLCQYLGTPSSAHDTVGQPRKRLHIQITRPFSSADILDNARRFCKIVELLYDNHCDVVFESNVSVGELFEKLDGADVLENGLVGDTVDAKASSLASSTVSEALRGIERCISRLWEAGVGQTD